MDGGYADMVVGDKRAFCMMCQGDNGGVSEVTVPITGAIIAHAPSMFERFLSCWQPSGHVHDGNAPDVPGNATAGPDCR